MLSLNPNVDTDRVAWLCRGLKRRGLYALGGVHRHHSRGKGTLPCHLIRIALLEIVNIGILGHLPFDVLRCAWDCRALVLLDAHKLVQHARLHSGGDVNKGELVLLEPKMLIVGILQVIAEGLRKSLTSFVSSGRCSAKSDIRGILLPLLVRIKHAVVVKLFAPCHVLVKHC